LFVGIVFCLLVFTESFHEKGAGNPTAYTSTYIYLIVAIQVCYINTVL